MSKTNQENIFAVAERVAKVLKDKGITKKDGTPNISKAEQECRMKGTVLQKLMKRGGSLYDDNLEKFLRTFHVNKEWLLRGKGDTYVKNGTSVDKTSDKDARLLKIRDEEIALLREENDKLRMELSDCKSRLK